MTVVTNTQLVAGNDSLEVSDSEIITARFRGVKTVYLSSEHGPTKFGTTRSEMQFFLYIG